MQEGDREAFETILAELFGALDKPLTEAKRDGFWKGLSKMSLIEFSRCRDQLLEELADGEARKSFAVSDVWAAKRRLRAPGAVFETKKDDWKGDGWDIESNHHFLAYLLRVMRENPKRYGAPASYLGMQRLSREEHPNADASPEFIRAVQILMTAKTLWARDMREAAEEGALPKDAGKAWFFEAMARAEETIAQPVPA